MTFMYPLIYEGEHLQETFTYLTKALEVLFVLEGTKPIARISLHQNELQNVLVFCERRQLRCAVSDFKIIHVQTEDKGVANKGVKVALASKIKGDLFLYVGKDQKLVEQAKQAEAENDHEQLGRLLGYPSCCIKFFKSEYDQEVVKENDYIAPALRNTRQETDGAGSAVSFYNNVILRYFDIGVLSHYPCSFTCSTSVELAKNNLEIVARYSPQLAEMMVTMLKCPVVFTEYDGAHILQGWRENKITGKIEFDNVLSTVQNNISFLLSEMRSIDKQNPYVICFH